MEIEHTGINNIGVDSWNINLIWIILVKKKPE